MARRSLLLVLLDVVNRPIFLLVHLSILLVGLLRAFLAVVVVGSV